MSPTTAPDRRVVRRLLRAASRGIAPPLAARALGISAHALERTLADDALRVELRASAREWERSLLKALRMEANGGSIEARRWLARRGLSLAGEPIDRSEVEPRSRQKRAAGTVLAIAVQVGATESTGWSRLESNGRHVAKLT